MNLSADRLCVLTIHNNLLWKHVIGYNENEQVIYLMFKFNLLQLMA